MTESLRHDVRSPADTLRRRAVPFAATGLLASSLVLWAVSLHSINLRRVTDVGLISALPPTFFAALLVLTVSFGLAVTGPRLVPLLFLQIGVQVLILFGTPSFIEYGPRTQSAWRLAGIVDYIARNHSIDRGIDAFFNWPGFFILVAFVTKAAGLQSSLELARWAPLFFNLAYLLPLFVIFRVLALSGRQVWIGLWIFVAGNWVGQDYLAPQAFAYFIYLTMIAVILAAFRTENELTSLRVLRGVPPRVLQVAAVAVVLVLQLVLAPSHQLTPWVATLAVAVLVLDRRPPSPALPVAMAVIAATWVAFFTGPYLAGHFSTVTGPVGSVSQNVDANLGNRFEGSVGHLFVLRVRVLFTLGLLMLGLLGALQIRRAGARLRTIALLAVAPFVMLGLQAYGGELLLRVFFFSLPFVALAGAAALAPLFSKPGSLGHFAAIGVLFVVAAGLLVARYGNEKMDFFTKDEIASMRFVFATAPANAQLFGADGNIPWQFEHYADFTHTTLPDSVVTESRINDVVREMRPAPRSSYLMITRGQAAGAELFRGWPPRVLNTFRAKLIRSGRFRVVYSNRDATVFKLRAVPARRAAK